MITDYFMITEKSNQLQVIMITDYDYPISVPITKFFNFVKVLVISQILRKPCEKLNFKTFILGPLGKGNFIVVFRDHTHLQFSLVFRILIHSN